MVEIYLSIFIVYYLLLIDFFKINNLLVFMDISKFEQSQKIN